MKRYNSIEATGGSDSRARVSPYGSKPQEQIYQQPSANNLRKEMKINQGGMQGVL